MRPGFIDGTPTESLFPLAKANYIGATKYQDTCSSTTGWTPTRVDSITLETLPGQSKASLKIIPQVIATTSHLITKTISSTDLSGVTHGKVRFYIPPGTPGGNDDFSNLSYATLQIRDAGALYREFNLWILPGTAGFSGWYESNFTLSDFSADSGVNLTAITSVRLWLTTVANKVPVFYLDDILFYAPINPTGLCMIFFDGPYSRQAAGMDYLKTKYDALSLPAVPVSIAINPNGLGTSGFMTAAQIRAYMVSNQCLAAIYGEDITGSYCWGAASAGITPLVTDADKIALFQSNKAFNIINGFIGPGLRGFHQHGSNNITANDFNITIPAVADYYTAGYGWRGKRQSAAAPYAISTGYIQGLSNPTMQTMSFFLGDADLSYRIANATTDHGLLVYGAHLKTDAELTQFQADMDAIFVDVVAGTIKMVSPVNILTGAGILT